MTRILCTCLLALLLLVTGCTTRPPANIHPPLLLISIDALRPSDVDASQMPTLNALADAGVRAAWMTPSYPSKTFPNHYTLVTGLRPDHHGMINNTMYDPELGSFNLQSREAVQDPRWWTGGEPVWITLQRHGGRAATMFWPGSDVAISGVRPDHWLYYDGSMSSSERVDHLLHWIDLPAAQRAQFYTLYFDAVDHASHSHGPPSPQVDAALAEVDDALGHLVAGLRARGLYDDTDLVIVSDHGGATTSKALRTYLDDVVPLADIKVGNYGVLATVTPLPGKQTSVEQALLKPHPHMTCWRKSQVPARLHYGSNPRLPPILCLAAEGGIITEHAYENQGGHTSVGEHGYDNIDPKMQALFIARGPDFRRGLVVPGFPNVDVYPLLAHLLRIQPAPNDGDFAAVAPLLRKP